MLTTKSLHNNATDYIIIKNKALKQFIIKDKKHNLETISRETLQISKDDKFYELIIRNSMIKSISHVW